MRTRLFDLRFSALSFVLLFGASLSFFTACSSLSSFSDLTAGQETKEAYLRERLNLFTRCLYWGSLDEASAYVTPEMRQQFYQNAAARRRDERYVDINVTDVSFMDSSSKAEVMLEVRYFKNPQYVVQTRLEKQLWEFQRIGGGWFMTASQVMPSEAKKQEEYRGLSPRSVAPRL